MDPTKDDTIRPESQEANGTVKVERPEPSLSSVAPRFSLFRYVALLATGLLFIGFLSTTGFMLLDYWMGETKNAGFFSEYLYRFHVYLLAALVLTGGLHVWMRLKTSAVDAESERPARVFRAIFLTILVLTMLGAIIATVHLIADLLLGTANTTVKGIWLAVLGSLQVVLWSLLAWWYFRKDRPGSLMAYAGGVGIITLIMAILLIVFPIFGKRDQVIDARTSSDLSAITASISKYASTNNKLPDDLADLELDDEKVKGRLSSYEYQKSESSAKPQRNTDLESLFNSDFYRPSTSSFSYKLCATFKTDTTKEEDEGGVIPLLTSSSGMQKHPKGKHCFDQTAYGKSSSASDSRSIEGLLGNGSSL